MRRAITTAAVVALVCASAALAADSVILIRNGTVVPVAGEPIKGGDVLVENGTIARIGNGLQAPAGAQIIDATGLFVYPGFIDAFSSYGLGEIGAVAATQDGREIGRENPDLHAAWAITPDTVHINVSRLNGTTTSLVAPSGGTFPGQTAIIKMAGWTFPEMALREVGPALINFPTTPKPQGEAAITTEEKPKVDVAAKLIERISTYLDEARNYWRLKDAVAKDPSLAPPAHNPKLEALKPVLDGVQPVILTVEKAKDIELAIKFAKDQKLKVILHGCAQGFQVAAKIKEAGLPVIVDDLYAGPVEFEDGYDAAWANVATMAKAGVTLCFSSGSALTGKDMPTFAARAVAFGMDHDEAIRALTLNPARVLGVADRIGSLEVGKDADLFLTTGDPLQITSVVKVMLINGHPVELKDNWWDAQADKWGARPAPTT
jgi:imidazolonepropionase-like amidohydrolase